MNDFCRCHNTAVKIWRNVLLQACIKNCTIFAYKVKKKSFPSIPLRVDVHLYLVHGNMVNNVYIEGRKRISISLD